MTSVRNEPRYSWETLKMNAPGPPVAGSFTTPLAASAPNALTAESEVTM